MQDEIVEAYKWAQQFKAVDELQWCHQIVLADALRDELARRLEVEHGDGCEVCFHWHGHEKNRCPKVSWHFSDWQAQAHKMLMGEA